VENSFPLDWIHYVDSAGAFQQASDASHWWHFTNAATHLISEQHGAIRKSAERLMRTSVQLQTAAPNPYKLMMWEKWEVMEWWQGRRAMTSKKQLRHSNIIFFASPPDRDNADLRQLFWKELIIWEVVHFQHQEQGSSSARYVPPHLSCMSRRTAAAKNLRWFRSHLSDLRTIACCPFLESDLISQTFPQ
jgi:hypothetical protein